MNGRMRGNHLQLDADSAQMLECARPARGAIGDRGERLARPFHV